MELKSLFLKGCIGRILSSVLRKKLKADSLELYLNDFSILDPDALNDDNITVHIDAYVKISKSDLQSLIRREVK